MAGLKTFRWQYVAAAIALLALAFFLPRHERTTDASSAQLRDAPVPAALLSGAADVTSSPSPLPSASVVYVCGAVRKPGVYRLAAGARIVDGLHRAGGATADADLEQLNLAEAAADGMKILVPHKGQVLPPAGATTAADFGLPAQSNFTQRSRHHHGTSGRHKLQPGQTLNVNTATEQELTTLPGVGPGLARRIIEYRTANGPFKTVDDLQNVSGIGPSKFDKMAPFVRLQG